MLMFNDAWEPQIFQLSKSLFLHFSMILYKATIIFIYGHLPLYDDSSISINSYTN